MLENQDQKPDLPINTGWTATLRSPPRRYRHRLRSPRRPTSIQSSAAPVRWRTVGHRVYRAPRSLPSTASVSQPSFSVPAVFRTRRRSRLRRPVAGCEVCRRRLPVSFQCQYNNRMLFYFLTRSFSRPLDRNAVVVALSTVLCFFFFSHFSALALAVGRRQRSSVSDVLLIRRRKPCSAQSVLAGTVLYARWNRCESDE